MRSVISLLNGSTCRPYVCVCVCLDGGRPNAGVTGVMVPRYCGVARRMVKGAITSKIKHAIKLKTSSARLAQLLCNSASLARLVLSFIACLFYL